MSDLLGRLVDRALDADGGLRPRTVARFEAPGAAASGLRAVEWQDTRRLATSSTSNGSHRVACTGRSSIRRPSCRFRRMQSCSGPREFGRQRRREPRSRRWRRNFRQFARRPASTFRRCRSGRRGAGRVPWAPATPPDPARSVPVGAASNGHLHRLSARRAARSEARSPASPRSAALRPATAAPATALTPLGRRRRRA